jgi:opacity protein-like surface antigen
VQQLLERSYVSSVNTVIALTADDYIGAGRYQIDDNDDINIFHFPLKYHFKPFTENWNLYVKGAYSRSEVEGKQEFAGYKIFDEDRPDTYVLDVELYKAGFGIRYKPSKQWCIDVGYALIYTQMKNSYAYNSFFSEVIIKPRVDGIVNGTQENWTTEYSIEYYHEMDLAGFTPYLMFEYDGFKTRAKLDLEEEVKIDALMELFHMNGGVLSPNLGEVLNRDVKLEGYGGRVNYYGDIRESLDGDHYYFYGVGLHLSDEESLFSKISVRSEWTESDSLSGFNIGLGVDFDF